MHSLTTLLRRAAALTVVCGASAAQAMPFGIYDPKSIAMGGTGVSAATSGNAAYFNPALLAAASPKDRFAIEIPVAAARLADPDKLADDVDRLDSTGQDLTRAIDQFNQAYSTGAPLATQQAAAAQLATALGNFRPELNKVSNKGLEASGFLAPLTVGVPGKKLGWGFHVAGRADVGAQFIYASSDDALLQSCQALAQAASTGTAADISNLLNNSQCGGAGTKLNDPQYQSRVNVRGIAIVEAGVSLAHHFESLDGLALGITPKAVKVRTFDYSISPQQAEISADAGRKDASGANLDFGAAKDLTPSIKAGLVVKNVLSRSYETALGNRIEVKPQARVGVSHHTNWTTVALDADLTNNAQVGFEKPTRFLGVGAEFDVRLIKLRAGYRADLTGNYKGIPSVGLGLSLFGLHVDIGAARRGNEELIAAAQLGFRF